MESKNPYIGKIKNCGAQKAEVKKPEPKHGKAVRVKEK